MQSLLKAKQGLHAAILLTLIGCASAPGDEPVWVAASDVDFADLHTFGWETSDAPVTIIDTEIRSAIRNGLIAKGYQETTTNPDFLVSHETLERDAIKQGNPVRIGIGVGSWGGNVGGSVGTSVDVGEKDKMVHELRIAIYMLDANGEREIWTGTSGAMPERPIAEAVSAAVAELLEAFPMRGNRLN
jgi:hypothetical protein